MAEARSEYFDAEDLARLRAALDEACDSLPLSRKTADTRTALAKAIIHLATEEGERDPVHLSTRALSALIIGSPDEAIRF